LNRVAVSGRAPNLFDARDLPGLAAWYRADQMLGFETGTVGTTNVIQEWGDLSGNGRHLFQPVSAARPILTTLANGRPAVLCDGTDDGMASAVWTAIAQPFTTVCVAQCLAVTVGQVLLGVSIGGGRFMSKEPAAAFRLNGGAIFDTSESLFPGGTILANLIYTVVWKGASTILRVNGNVLNTGNAGTTTFDSVTVGKHPTAAISYWNGPIEEISVHARELSTAEMLQLERAHGVRYQIAGVP